MKKIRRIFNKISRIFNYIPVLWNVYDFDYSSSIILLKHQLKRQADFLESDKALTLESKPNSEKIRMVIRLMDKVYDEYYSTEYQDKLIKKYGDDVLDTKFFEIKDKPGYSELKYKYEYDDKFKDIKESIKLDKEKWFKESKNKQERAHKLLWDLFEHYIRNWWD